MTDLRVLICVLFPLFAGSAVHSQELYLLKSGRIAFVSDAPLEIIAAETHRFQFAIDTAKREFALRIEVRSFEGFNSALQQEHFRENYMEVDKFPHAVFSGKILESLHDRNQPFELTVKGSLQIHGRKVDRVMKASCRFEPSGDLSVSSNFDIPLNDHDIEIPRIVHQKIAEVIHVEVDAVLSPATP